MAKLNSLKLENIGQIKCADVTFGDLTVFVGPQATGKSIFFQFLKLAIDKRYVHEQLRKHGIDWGRDESKFLDVYLGEGMRGIWGSEEPPSTIKINGTPWEIRKLITGKRAPRTGRSVMPGERVFYIPAQRVLSLANGWPRPFQGFASEDPFVVRDFSETFRLLMEQEFIRSKGSKESKELFPQTNRLKQEYRQLLSKHIFGGFFGLYVDHHGAQKRLVLRHKNQDIPFMAWSAGQREFVPLLMGLYWLMPAGSVQRRGNIKWVVIEELEMGLHPNAISVVLLLVLELLWRGYRVCLSTHSPHVLDLVWAIQKIQRCQADSHWLLDIFEVRKSERIKEVAKTTIKKKVRVYYFDSKGKTHDISDLDPGAEDKDMAGWGGLTEFSSRVNDIVAQVVANAPLEPSEEPPELPGSSLPLSNQPTLPQIEENNL